MKYKFFHTLTWHLYDWKKNSIIYDHYLTTLLLSCLGIGYS